MEPSTSDRDLPGDVLAVKCPRCDAEPGRPCLSPKGAAVRVHALRRQSAEAADTPPDPLEVLTTPAGRAIYANIEETLAARDERNAVTLMLALRAARNAESATDLAEIAIAKPHVAGSNGQPVANPAWATCARLEDRIVADLKALRMTPDTAGWTKPTEQAGDELDELDELASRRAKRG